MSVKDCHILDAQVIEPSNNVPLQHDVTRNPMLKALPLQ